MQEAADTQPSAARAINAFLCHNSLARKLFDPVLALPRNMSVVSATTLILRAVMPGMGNSLDRGCGYPSALIQCFDKGLQ